MYTLLFIRHSFVRLYSCEKSRLYSCEKSQPTLAQGIWGPKLLELNVMNVCLLSKRIWKLKNGQGVWQDLLRIKYVKKTVSSYEKKTRAISLLQGIMNVKDLFYRFCREKMVMVKGKVLGRS